jgi:hypothetical protein
LKPYWSLQWEHGSAWPIIRFVPRVARCVPQVELDLFSLPQHLSSPQIVHVLLGFVLFIFVKLHVDVFTFLLRDALRHDLLLFCIPIVFFLYLEEFHVFLMLFAFTDVQHDVHVRWRSCRLIVTRRVSQMRKELLILSEDPS